MILNSRSTTTIIVNLGICVSLLVGASVAHADIIFTNFGPGLSYNTSLGNPVGDGLDGSGFDYAEGGSFTAGLTANLSSVVLALSCALCPAGGSLTVGVTQNAGGQPGGVLESFSVLASTLGILGLNNPPITVSSLAHPLLSLGTQYWVTVIGPPTSAVAWNWNSTGDVSPEAISGDGGASWFSPSGLTPGAFGINGVPATAPVPEPGTVWLLSSGMLALGAVKFHRRRKQRTKGSRML